MTRKLLFILAALSALLTAKGETLTLEQCVSLAQENYPAIARYGIIEQTARYDLSNASKPWLPQGSVSGQLTWQNDVASWPDQFAAMLAQQGLAYLGVDKTQYRGGLDLNQQIWDGGTTAANKRIIRLTAEMERQKLETEIYDVKGRVEDIYFGILLLDGRISSLARTMTLVDSTLHQVTSMKLNGVAMQSDCDQVEARLLTLQQQSTELAATRSVYLRILEIFIGEPIGDRALILPKAAPTTPAERPQLSLFDSQMRLVTSQEHGVTASVMPRIGAFASGYYGYPGYNMFKSMQDHSPTFNLMAGIKVTWNFGALYTRSNSLSRLQSRRQEIEANRQTFLFNNSIAETEKKRQITSLREVMENDERIVALRRSVVRAAQSQLRNGVIDTTALLAKITDVMLAENDLLLHEISLTQAIYNLNHISNR